MTHDATFRTVKAPGCHPVHTITCTCGWWNESYSRHTARQHYLQHVAAAHLAEQTATLQEPA